MVEIALGEHRNFRSKQQDMTHDVECVACVRHQGTDSVGHRGTDYVGHRGIDSVGHRGTDSVGHQGHRHSYELMV